MPDTPDTTAYLYLGLVAVFIIMTVLIGSMIIRYRGLQKDLETIERLTEDE